MWENVACECVYMYVCLWAVWEIFIYRLLLLDDTTTYHRIGLFFSQKGFLMVQEQFKHLGSFSTGWYYGSRCYCAFVVYKCNFAKLWWQIHILWRHSYLYVSYCEHADFPCAVVWTPLIQDGDTWITFEAVAIFN